MLCNAVESCKKKLFSDATNVMKARVDSTIYKAHREVKESLSTTAVEVCGGITGGVRKLICGIVRCKPLCPLSGNIPRQKVMNLKHSQRYRQLSRLLNNM